MEKFFCPGKIVISDMAYQLLVIENKDITDYVLG